MEKFKRVAAKLGIMRAGETKKTHPGFAIFIQGALLLSALQGASFALLLFDRGVFRPRRFVIVAAFSLMWTLVLHVRSGLGPALHYILWTGALSASLTAAAFVIFIPFERWTFQWWSLEHATIPLYLSFIPLGLFVGTFAFIHVRILNSMLAEDDDSG